MNKYYNGKPHPFEMINYMTLEQQAQVIKLIEEIEAAEHLTIPRIIMSIDENSCWMRSKNDERYWISKLGASPIKAFIEYMRAEQKLLIGEPMAQMVVEGIGSVLPLPQEFTFNVKGRSLESGSPASLEISSIEVREVLLSKSFDENFVNNLKQYLSNVPIWHHISYKQQAQAQIILRESLPYIRGMSDWLQDITKLKVVIE